MQKTPETLHDRFFVLSFASTSRRLNRRGCRGGGGGGRHLMGAQLRQRQWSSSLPGLQRRWNERARASEGLKWQKVENGTKRASAAAARTDHRIRKSARPLLLALVSLRRRAGADRPREGRRGASQNCRCSSVSSLVPPRRVQRRRRELRRRSHLDGGGGSVRVVQPPYKRGPGRRAAAAAAKLKFSRLSLFCGSENYTSRQDATRRHSCWSNKIGGMFWKGSVAEFVGE